MLLEFHVTFSLECPILWVSDSLVNFSLSLICLRDNNSFVFFVLFCFYLNQLRINFVDIGWLAWSSPSLTTKINIIFLVLFNVLLLYYPISDLLIWLLYWNFIAYIVWLHEYFCLLMVLWLRMIEFCLKHHNLTRKERLNKSFISSSNIFTTRL